MNAACQGNFSEWHFAHTCHRFASPDLDEVEKIVLKWILNKYSRSIWIAVIWLRVYSIGLPLWMWHDELHIFLSVHYNEITTIKKIHFYVKWCHQCAHMDEMKLFWSVWKHCHLLNKCQLINSLSSSTKSELRSSGCVNGEYKNICSVNCRYGQEVLTAPTGAETRELLKLTRIDRLLLVPSMEGYVFRPRKQLRLLMKQPLAFPCNLIRPLLTWRIYTGIVSKQTFDIWVSHVIWDVKPRSLVLHILTEVSCYSETSAYCHQTARRCIPECSNLHTRLAVPISSRLMVKVMVKATLEMVTKAQRERRGIAVLFPKPQR